MASGVAYLESFEGSVAVMEELMLEPGVKLRIRGSNFQLGVAMAD